MINTITNKQLSNIVTALLVNPDGVGELSDSHSHQAFVSDIAHVVAQYCGGEVTEPVSLPSGVFNIDILPTESLPDIKNNVWIDPLWRTELFQTIALSTTHLSPVMMQRLTEEAASGANNMVMARDTGFFIKLYAKTGDRDEQFDPLGGDSQERYPCQAFHHLMSWASSQGIAVVELDVDAATLEAFEVFEH